MHLRSVWSGMRKVTEGFKETFRLMICHYLHCCVNLIYIYIMLKLIKCYTLNMYSLLDVDCTSIVIFKRITFPLVKTKEKNEKEKW